MSSLRDGFQGMSRPQSLKISRREEHRRLNVSLQVFGRNSSRMMVQREIQAALGFRRRKPLLLLLAMLLIAPVLGKARETQRPHILGVAHIALYVSDLDKARS